MPDQDETVQLRGELAIMDFLGEDRKVCGFGDTTQFINIPVDMLGTLP